MSWVSLKSTGLALFARLVHTWNMPRRSSMDRDFAVNAFRVVEQAIGEHMDGTPMEESKPKNNRSIGGKIGGLARSKSLTAEQKRQIAVKAAQARWHSRKDG